MNRKKKVVVVYDEEVTHKPLFYFVIAIEKLSRM